MNGKCEFRLQGAPLDCSWLASTVMRGKNNRRKKACGVHRLVALGQGWIDETDELVERKCDQERAIRNAVDTGHVHRCDRCHQYCTVRYPFPPEPGLLVCGFCVGFGGDGKPTGKYGKLPTQMTNA